MNSLTAELRRDEYRRQIPGFGFGRGVGDGHGLGISIGFGVGDGFGVGHGRGAGRFPSSVGDKLGRAVIEWPHMTRNPSPNTRDRVSENGRWWHERAVYLPLEHSENRKHQRRSVELFQELASETPADAIAVFEGFLDYAVRHKDIIDQFGRFPHRNAILGRRSTPREKEFLKQPGSSF